MTDFQIDREYICKRVKDEDGIGGIAYKFEGEIIRCSECKWRGKDEWCYNNLRYVMDDGFCAWGERK